MTSIRNLWPQLDEIVNVRTDNCLQPSRRLAATPETLRNL
jgi:hypothetical protein